MTWWTVFYVVLAIKIETETKPKKGHQKGAPKNPALGKRSLITTIISIFLSIAIIKLKNIFVVY
jgi:predicted secreted protein